MEVFFSEAEKMLRRNQKAELAFIVGLQASLLLPLAWHSHL